MNLLLSIINCVYIYVSDDQRRKNKIVHKTPNNRSKSRSRSPKNTNWADVLEVFFSVKIQISEIQRLQRQFYEKT